MASFYDCLIKESDYTTFETTWSPGHSSVGIGAGGEARGAGPLYFHYNRFTRAVFERFIGFPLKLNAGKTSIISLVFGENTVLASAGCNGFVFESAELDGASLFDVPCTSTKNFRLAFQNGKNAYFTGFSVTEEARDPDKEVPFGIAVYSDKGILEEKDGGFYVKAGEDGKLRFSVFVSVLAPDAGELTKQAENAALIPTAEHIARDEGFFRETASHFPETCDDDASAMAAGAVRALIMNTTRGEGKLSGYLSCYPNRGQYPTHFLWDTYFQNLGYSVFGKKEAVGFLLQIASNCRGDGKLPQFMCSTWDRPQDSQPPLFGWAVVNILDAIDDEKELGMLYSALCRNNGWWLRARLAPCGLVYSPSGLETGQDDAPRFDGGAAIPCDMNAYLLNQLRSTAVVAGKLGDEAGVKHWTELADDFSEKIYRVLFCREHGLFFDVSRETGEFIPVRSNACVMPLWAGVKMPENEIRQILRGFLLNENAMFGEVPFPSVAYDDSHYRPGDWWRGPTWMPVAYLLCETAEKYGFHAEARAAKEKLYNVILRDGCFHELFDSQTGKGLGSAQQGWTGGIFIKLYNEFHNKG